MNLLITTLIKMFKNRVGGRRFVYPHFVHLGEGVSIHMESDCIF